MDVPVNINAQLLALIDENGWAVRHVGAGDTPGEVAFSYTIGLTALGHPEFIMQGMPFEHAQTFLNLLGEEVFGGRQYVANSIVEDLTEEPAPMAFIPAIDASGLTAVINVYGSVDALQIVWSDSKGHLPWEDGYRNSPDAQPLLGPIPATFTH